MSRRIHSPAHPARPVALDPGDAGALRAHADAVASGMQAAMQALCAPHDLDMRDVDIALLVDAHGVLTTVTQDERRPMCAAAQDWVGHPWAFTVTEDTRPKIDSLLFDAARGVAARCRQVNHDDGSGVLFPVAYTARRLGTRGLVLALGRDLRGSAALQQVVVDTQQAAEGGYWHRRQASSNSAWLAQAARDGALAVEPGSLRVLALNPMAEQCLGRAGEGLVGRPLMPLFDARSRPGVAALLALAGAGSATEGAVVRLAGSHASVQAFARTVRADHLNLASGIGVIGHLSRHRDDSAVVLLHLRRDPLPQHAAPGAEDEGFVVADASGHVRDANDDFLQMVQASGVDAVRGRLFADCCSGTGGAVVQRVRAQGVAGARRAALQRRDGTQLPVQLSGALLAESAAGEAGFVLRRLGARGV